MSDQETIAIYDAQVEAYVNIIEKSKTDPTLEVFIKHLKAGNLVLDLGCGPGNSSSVMQNRGLKVDAIDASKEMIKIAKEKYSINAKQATFDDLDSLNTYDGIWANFSLLHAASDDFPRHLNDIHDALVPNGIFHIAMKTGDGMKRDKLGRRYSYYSEQELITHLKTTGFSILEKTNGIDKALSGEMSPWVAILCKR